LHSIHLDLYDLKLENVVIGADDPNKIYLIDFGLTSKIVDDEGEHIVKEYIRNFSGNFLFASLNSCRGFNKSRRDDIKSILKYSFTLYKKITFLGVIYLAKNLIRHDPT
jgi:casein kinase 1